MEWERSRKQSLGGVNRGGSEVNRRAGSERAAGSQSQFGSRERINTAGIEQTDPDRQDTTEKTHCHCVCWLCVYIKVYNSCGVPCLFPGSIKSLSIAASYPSLKCSNPWPSGFLWTNHHHSMIYNGFIVDIDKQWHVRGCPSEKCLYGMFVKAKRSKPLLASLG